MESKQTLKVGQKYRVNSPTWSVEKYRDKIVTVHRITLEDQFRNEEGDLFDISLDKLQLITPKKEVKKVNDMNFNSGDFELHLGNGDQVTIYDGYTKLRFGTESLTGLIQGLNKIEENIHTKSTPKKKSKEIKFEEIKGISYGPYISDPAEFNSNYIHQLWRNQNKLIRNQKKLQDTINLLIKNK